jgi:hypothetical protein
MKSIQLMPNFRQFFELTKCTSKWQKGKIRTSYSICPFFEMQGGRFDIGGRLFSRIQGTFTLISTFSNDYRELISEFFAFHEFLVNSNNFDLGKVNGEKIGDVELPGWAESPLHFVYTNRKALESDFVSARLHQWIDLVFGKLQRGPGAVAAMNTYPPAIYEDIWSLKSHLPEDRISEVETMQMHIGQVPPQMFIEGHPTRTPLHPIAGAAQSFDLQKEFKAAHLAERKGGRVWLTVGSDEVSVYEINLRNGGDIERVERFSVGESVREIVHAKEVVLSTASGAVFEGRRRLLDRSSAFDARGSYVCSIRETVVDARCSRAACTIPFFGDPAVCLCVSPQFRALVVGTECGRVVFCALPHGKRIRAIEIEGKPRKILITASLGFVVAASHPAAADANRCRRLLPHRAHNQRRGRSQAPHGLGRRLLVLIFFNFHFRFRFRCFCDQAQPHLLLRRILLRCEAFVEVHPPCHRPPCLPPHFDADRRRSAR